MSRSNWLYPSIMSLLVLISFNDSVSAQGVDVDYFSGRTFNEHQLTLDGSEISFDWERESPFEDGPRDNFSVRWAGRIVADTTGVYQFRANYDDGYRLWIGDQLIINGWSGGPAIVIGEFSLESGRLTPILAEFFEAGGNAHALLEWRLADGVSEFEPIDLRSLRRPQAHNGLPRVGIIIRDGRSLEGTDPARFTLYRIGGLDDELEVQLTFSGEAEEGLDYVNPPRLVTIPSGQHAKDIEISRVDDQLARGAKNLRVSIATNEGYTLLRDTEIALTFLDDERDGSSVDRYTLAGAISGVSSAYPVILELEGNERYTQTQYGQGEFSFPPLNSGEYTLKAWYDRNEDGLLSMDEEQAMISLDGTDEQALFSVTLPPHLLGIHVRFNVLEEMVGGEAGGEMVGGEMVGGEMAGGEMAGGEMGIDMSAGESVMSDSSSSDGCGQGSAQGTLLMLFILLTFIVRRGHANVS
jgi:hypothetical protein